MTPSRRAATISSVAGGLASTLVSSVAALVLVPICLSAVGPRLYGAWLASGDVLFWIQAFDLGLPNLMIQRLAVADGKGDTRTVGEYFATAALILGFVALIIAASLIAAAPLIPLWLGLEGYEAWLLTACLRLGALASGLTLWNNTVVGYSRAVQDTAQMNAVAVASNLASFLVTLGLLALGWGLWSLVLGMMARTVVLLFGSAVFLVSRRRRGLLEHLGVRRTIAWEMVRISPVTALGGFAYAIMNQSENALVGIVLRPEVVPILALTRKGADVLRGLLDTLAFATYGGFAHLVGSRQRHRSQEVHAEIVWLNLTLGIAAATTFMALNPSFVSRWVGPSLFGGPWLTVAIGAQMVVVSVSFLANYLYRATGQVSTGSIALAVEGVVRIPLVVVMLLSLGLAGVPLAAVITAGVALAVVLKWTVKELSYSSAPPMPTFWRTTALRLSFFTAGAAACFVLYAPSWPFIVLTGLALFIATAGLLLIADRSVARSTRAWLAALVSGNA